MANKIRKQTRIWTTHDKLRVRVCDMSDSHLDNTIKMFVRSFKVYLQGCQHDLLSYLSTGPPDGAEMCAERELGEIESMLYDGFENNEPDAFGPTIKEAAEKKHPIMLSMVLEQKRRSELSTKDHIREIRERYEINKKVLICQQKTR